MMDEKYPGVFIPRPRNGKRIYGDWAGNPKGNPERRGDCIVQVCWDRMIDHQCTRKRGHGPDGLFCKQHARKIAEAQRNE